MDPNSKHVNPNPVDTDNSDSVKVAHDEVPTYTPLSREIPSVMLKCAPFNEEDQIIIIPRVISLAEQIDYQPERLTNVLESGINLLLAHTGILIIPPSHSLLCLQVVLKVEQEKMVKEYRDLAESRVSHANDPIYQLSVEDATGLLLDYDDCWIHSLSTVLVDINSFKISTCNLESRANEATIEPSNHTGITLFALAGYVIDDQVISNRDKLKEFLEDLGQKEIQKVHVTCSSVAYGKEEYNHVIV